MGELSITDPTGHQLRLYLEIGDGARVNTPWAAIKGDFRPGSVGFTHLHPDVLRLFPTEIAALLDNWDDRLARDPRSGGIRGASAFSYLRAELPPRLVRAE